MPKNSDKPRKKTAEQQLEEMYLGLGREVSRREKQRHFWVKVARIVDKLRQAIPWWRRRG